MLVNLRSLTKTKWRHGLSTMPGCSMLNLSGQATRSLRSLQLLPPSQHVRDPDPPSTQQNEMQKDHWSIWHRSWDAENCWWGRDELARQLTDAVFSCGVIPSDWEESSILNLYKGKGEALDRVFCCCGIGRNSILCTQCMLWVYMTCSGKTKWLVEDPNYICPQCKGESWPIDGRSVTEMDIDGTMLDVEFSFWYLVDMLQYSSGGCVSAIAARWCVSWGKFRKLLRVLTTRHLSPRIRGKLHEACVRSFMLHNSEKWGPKEPELQQLFRDKRAMIHWIYGIKDKRRNTLSFTTTETEHQEHYIGSSLSATQMIRPCMGHVLYQIYHKLSNSRHQRERKGSENIVWICADWCQWVA